MNNDEKKLSDYIDKLNAEKKPAEHEESITSAELEELFNAVRKVRRLREPELPGKEYPLKVAGSIYKSIPQNEEAGQIKKPSKTKRKWVISVAAAAAIILVVTAVNLIMPFTGTNIVNAMEKAYNEAKAYHGIMEVVETNAEGQSSVQAKLEVWADKEGHYMVKELEGSQKGMVTANNGGKKWQLRPDEKQSYVYTGFPDPYRFTFEIGSEVEDIKNALKTKVIGEEIISGRIASIIEVTPKGGLPYKLWIDKETKMPLQKQSSMQNALEYKVTYSDIDYIDTLPKELITYKLPEGFREIHTNPELLVSNIAEAEEALGFSIAVPQSVPEKFTLDSIAVSTENKTARLYYTSEDKNSRLVIIQGKASGEFKPASTAILGKVGKNAAEIQSPVENGNGILSGVGAYSGINNIRSIRWQQSGMEYAVIGNLDLNKLELFVTSLVNEKVQLPTSMEQQLDKPQIDVPYDLEVEKNEQKSVDAGHSPWKLDPAFVAQVFVSLKISPEGIIGDYPIAYENFNVIKNDGKDAVVEVSGDKTPVKKVYLKRLVRQDNTGIWTVVGYDPVK